MSSDTETRRTSDQTEEYSTNTDWWPTWRCRLNSSSAWRWSPCFSRAPRRRRGTNRWPDPATTPWAGRPAYCPESGGHRLSGGLSWIRQRARRRPPTACSLTWLRTIPSWSLWSVLVWVYASLRTDKTSVPVFKFSFTTGNLNMYNNIFFFKVRWTKGWA